MKSFLIACQVARHFHPFLGEMPVVTRRNIVRYWIKGYLHTPQFKHL